MGRLSGFRYREIVRRLRAHGFEFGRQGADSHEIWFNPSTKRYTTIPNHPGGMPEGHYARFLGKREYLLIISVSNQTLERRQRLSLVVK